MDLPKVNTLLHLLTANILPHLQPMVNILMVNILTANTTGNTTANTTTANITESTVKSTESPMESMEENNTSKIAKGSMNGLIMTTDQTVANSLELLSFQSYQSQVAAAALCVASRDIIRPFELMRDINNQSRVKQRDQCSSNQFRFSMSRPYQFSKLQCSQPLSSCLSNRAAL